MAKLKSKKNRTNFRLTRKKKVGRFDSLCQLEPGCVKLLSSDEFIRIYSNFEISNFEKRIRMSNLIEFDFLKQIRLNSTSHLAKIGLFKSLFNQKRSF